MINLSLKVFMLRFSDFVFIVDWFFPTAVDKVIQGQDRVTKEHAWAGVAHHGSHLLPHYGLVAMDGAFGAGRFALLIRALVETKAGILQELVACCA
jgi:hypothetical protein